MTMLLLLYLFGVITLATTGAQEYHGCYENLDFTEGISREFKDFNLNDDCAAFCASQGFILAATHNDECHCTNHMPRNESIVESPRDMHVDVHRFNNPCGIACPGALVTRYCRGDECCGGITRHIKRYSLYAVGAIDPAHVYIRRIRKSLMERRHPWLDFNLRDERPTCFSNFVEVRSMHGYLQLDKELSTIGDFRTTDDVDNLEGCLEKCRIFSAWSCQAVTYFPEHHECVLIVMSSLTANLTLSKRETQFYDRNCTSRVQVLPSSLQMDPLRQSVSDETGPGGDMQEVVDTEDVELDLTDSANWETTYNSVTFTTSEDYSTETHSGFTWSSSSRLGQDSTGSRTDSRETSQGTMSGSEKNLGISVGASAEADFGFVKGSVDVEANVDTSSSRQTTNERSQSASRTGSDGIGSSNSSSGTGSFKYDHESTEKKTRTHTYGYSMTVPAQHKGVMTFFVKKETLIRKVVTDLQLNGYIKVLIRGSSPDEQDEIRMVHVARVLSPRERELSVLTENIYQRQVFVAKITITDPQGIDVSDEKQLI